MAPNPVAPGTADDPLDQDLRAARRRYVESRPRTQALHAGAREVLPGGVTIARINGGRGRVNMLVRSDDGRDKGVARPISRMGWSNGMWLSGMTGSWRTGV
jgi:hypothetical protein